MSVMALQRGGFSALAACRALRAAGPARALHLLPAAGLHAPPHAGQERRALRSWLWAAVAPVALSASRAVRVAGIRSLHVSCCSDGNLPATFVAPTKVNMDDYPPPKRRLSKGAASPEQPLRPRPVWRVTCAGARARSRLLPRTQTTSSCSSCAAAVRAGRT